MIMSELSYFNRVLYVNLRSLFPLVVWCSSQCKHAKTNPMYLCTPYPPSVAIGTPQSALASALFLKGVLFFD